MDPRLASLLPVLPVFGGLDEREQEKVSSLLRWRSVQAGTVVAPQGEIADTMFIIVEGHCRVSVDGGPAAGPVVIAELGPGQVFGEMALVDMQPRSASVEALTDVDLVTLTNSDFLDLYQWNLPTYSLVLLNVTREISRRLRRANGIIASCARALRESVRE